MAKAKKDGMEELEAHLKESEALEADQSMV